MLFCSRRFVFSRSKNMVTTWESAKCGPLLSTKLVFVPSYLLVRERELGVPLPNDRCKYERFGGFSGQECQSAIFFISFGRQKQNPSFHSHNFKILQKEKTAYYNQNELHRHSPTTAYAFNSQYQHWRLRHHDFHAKENSITEGGERVASRFDAPEEHQLCSGLRKEAIQIFSRPGTTSTRGRIPKHLWSKQEYDQV